MLLDEPPPERPHFCLAVDGDLAGLRARLERAGIETRDGTELVGRPRFTCRDPFGNLVELARVEVVAGLSGIGPPLEHRPAC